MPITLSNLPKSQHSHRLKFIHKIQDSYRFRGNLPIRNPIVSHTLLSPRRVYTTVDNSQRDMYALRSKLPSERLRNSPLRKLASRKGSEFGGTPDGGCGSGDEQTGRVRRRSNSIQELGESFLSKVKEAISRDSVSDVDIIKANFVSLGYEINLRRSPKASIQIINLQLQKRLIRKPSIGIIHRRRQLMPL